MQQNKHDHKFTNKLKAIIFAMFLLLPFLTMLPNAIYYAFNDNATNSHIEQTTINYKYETNEVNSLDDLVNGNVYEMLIDMEVMPDELILKFNPDNNIQNFDYIYFDFEYFDFTSYAFDEVLGIIGQSTLNSIIFDPTNLMVYISINTFDMSDNIIMFEDVTLKGMFIFVYNENENFFSATENYCSKLLECPKEYIPIESVETTNQEMTITENLQFEFEKQWTNNPLFNWTQNNPIKQPINQFVNIFGIQQNTPLTNYLTYMISFIAIYIVFDIIIELFTFLTHLLTSKNTN